MSTTELPNKFTGYPAIGDASWGATLNSTFINIDSAFGGNQAFALGAASGVVSVNNNVYTGNYPANTASYVPLSWTLTGTLTANVNLQLPTGVGGHWLVNNQCTMGAYTITVSAVSGVTSATLMAGIQEVYSDGLGNINFVTSMGAFTGNVSATGSVTAGTTLNAGTNITGNGTISMSGGATETLNLVATSGTVTLTANAGTGYLANTGAGNFNFNVPTGYGYHFEVNGAGVGNLTASGLAVPASITSTSGGFIFPDGTTQTTFSPPTPWAITGGLPTSMTGTNTTANIQFSATTCSDASGTVNLIGGPFTLLASNGNAANGFSTGSPLTSSQTYHVYICKGGSGYCGYASTSANMSAGSAPTGYNTYVRRLFSFTTNGSGAPNPFVSDEINGGAYIAYLATPVLDINGVTVTTANRTLYSLSIPLGVKMQWQGRPMQSGSWVGIYTSPDESDIAPSTTVAPLADTQVYSMSVGRAIITNTSGQIGVRGTTGGTLYLATSGWIDNRRS